MEINEGTVVIWQNCYYHGAEAMHLLSILGSEHGIFSLLNKLLFRHRYVAAALYPLLVTCRKLALSLLRRNLILHS